MPSKPFLSGVIEGFYGQVWSQSSRLAYADYLEVCGLNTYLYCPKADAVLRRRWRERWAPAEQAAMWELGEAYRAKGLYWGVGLSPYELYRQYGAPERTALRSKIEYLAELEAPLLALLFDDMPGDIDDLAARQAEIVHDVTAWLPGVRLLVCPTYYSFDPVLERVFGAMDAQYWPELGRALPPEVDVFWTGNKVCSESITADDVSSISQQLGRAVTLWDNYPVNDNATRCQHLYSRPLAGREGLSPQTIAGHLCNPMNQAHLSLPALSGLAELYGAGRLEDDTLSELLGGAFWARFKRDARRFECEPLDAMAREERAELERDYAQIPGEAAREVVQWLRGEFAFDPACLTDE